MNLFKGYLPSGGADGKRPSEPYKNRSSFYELSHVEELESYGGVLKDGLVQIDVDDGVEASKLFKIVEELDVQCDVLKTTRGMHFYFNNTCITKRGQGLATPIGILVDTGLGVQNAVIPLKVLGVKREWYRRVDELQELPIWLKPVAKQPFDFKAMKSGDGRNPILFKYILVLQQEGLSKDEIKETIRIINKYILEEPLDENEIDTILRDESFMKETFYVKNSLQYEKLASYMRDNDHIIKINGTLHIYHQGVYTDNPLYIERRMLTYIRNSTSTHRNEVLKYLDLLCEEHEMCSSQYVAVGNGILNLETMEIIPFTPNIVIKNKVNYCYNVGAKNEPMEHMLDRITCGDAEMRLLLEEMVGYTLLRRNELGKAFILTGGGSNGKSTFFECIIRLLGKENISSVSLEELGHRFKTYQLEGKLANIGDDISNKYIEDNSTFKKLATGEAVNVERKGRDAYDMHNYAKLIFSANELPRINDYSEGLKRRIIFIPFKAKFKRTDKDFDPFIGDKLRSKEAMEYLLKVAVNGLRRLLINGGFTSSEACDNVWREYEAINNPILAFVDEVDVVNESCKDAYLKYATWCVDGGLKNVSKPIFGRELKKLGYNSDRVIKKGGKSIRVWSIVE